MKELEFRAWDEYRKRFHTSVKWVEFLVRDGKLTARNYGRGGNVVQLPIEQFTGILDKNGNKIYTKDLIKNGSGRVAVVVWNKYIAGFDCEVFGDTWKGTNSHGLEVYEWGSEVEVIGNVYENSGLIGGDVWKS